MKCLKTKEALGWELRRPPLRHQLKEKGRNEAGTEVRMDSVCDTCCSPVISPLRTAGQKHPEFENSLNYTKKREGRDEEERERSEMTRKANRIVSPLRVELSTLTGHLTHTLPVNLQPNAQPHWTAPTGKRRQETRGSPAMH